MPFGVVSGVDRGMGVLDEDGDRQRGRGSFGVNMVHPVITNVILCVRSGDAAHPKLLLDFLVSFRPRDGCIRWGGDRS